MTDVLSSYDQPAPKRPTFLSVICILTFIGSGWGAVSGIIGYLNAETTSATMRETKANTYSGESGAEKFAQNMMDGLASTFTVENLKIASIAGAAAAVLCLIGAFLMWNLKKVGFYSYVLGTVIGLAVPLYLFGGNIFAVMGTAIGGLIGVAFCIMYGIHLKYMK